MSTLIHPRPLVVRALTVTVAALTMIAASLFVLVDAASAHGSTIDPMSRNYSCWKRWGSDFQNPTMATTDPMCWQAWQDNPNAMWNWNGLYKEQVNNDHQAAVPDGQLCSGGLAEGGRYRSMDTVGDWKATDISNNFTLKYHDQARHGATYVLVYVTKQGYNPLTTPLKWSDLELVTQTGAIAPGAGTTESDPVLSGVTVSIAVNAPGRTGRHIVYTIWRAAHADQNYYWCADVNFGGTSTPTTPPATTTPPTTAAPTTAAPSPTTAAPTTTGTPSAKYCAASFTNVSQWTGGFQGEITVNAGAVPIAGWTVTATFPNGQSVTQVWNAQLISSSGSTFTLRNVSYNGSIPANGSTSFGFLGSWSNLNGAPTLSCIPA